MTYFTVDGYAWDFPCAITREAEVKASDISGMLLDGNYFNGVLGTYMKYTVTVVVPLGKEGAYANLYELLTRPQDAHTFVLPYNQDTITITGRVGVVQDQYFRKENGRTIWRHTTFTVTANNPSKDVTTAQAISRGISAMPSVTLPVQEGDTYTYTAAGWVKVET